MVWCPQVLASIRPRNHFGLIRLNTSSEGLGSHVRPRIFRVLDFPQSYIIYKRSSHSDTPERGGGEWNSRKQVAISGALRKTSLPFPSPSVVLWERLLVLLRHRRSLEMYLAGPTPQNKQLPTQLSVESFSSLGLVRCNSLLSDYYCTYQTDHCPPSTDRRRTRTGRLLVLSYPSYRTNEGHREL